MFHARVDLPGVKKEDVKVEIAEAMLTIRGGRRHEEERTMAEAEKPAVRQLPIG